MVRSVAGDLPEQVKNNQSVNMAAGNGGQEISQYSWFTVYSYKVKKEISEAVLCTKTSEISGYTVSAL